MDLTLTAQCFSGERRNRWLTQFHRFPSLQESLLPPSAIMTRKDFFPRVERKNGIRLFSDMDIRWLHLLTCLKNTGMPIKRIRKYAELTLQGDTSLKERQALIREQRQFVQDQIDQLLFYMQELDLYAGTGFQGMVLQ